MLSPLEIISYFSTRMSSCPPLSRFIQNEQNKSTNKPPKPLISCKIICLKHILHRRHIDNYYHDCKLTNYTKNNHNVLNSMWKQWLTSSHTKPHVNKLRHNCCHIPSCLTFIHYVKLLICIITLRIVLWKEHRGTWLPISTRRLIQVWSWNMVIPINRHKCYKANCWFYNSCLQIRIGHNFKRYKSITIRISRRSSHYIIFRTFISIRNSRSKFCTKIDRKNL